MIEALIEQEFEANGFPLAEPEEAVEALLIQLALKMTGVLPNDRAQGEAALKLAAELYAVLCDFREKGQLPH